MLNVLFMLGVVFRNMVSLLLVLCCRFLIRVLVWWVWELFMGGDCVFVMVCSVLRCVVWWLCI